MPEPEFSALQAAHQREYTEAFKETYKKQASVEGPLSQATHALGMRRAR
jgi:hypothetical protein